ncbi:MAG: flagellar basal body-associated FliL family protein [Luminiphilus sp.]|jgi:flagellar FliL protein|nr:flagellar basal body-associated FliL family protein [Luminiphilus sp.]MBT6350681.1 flagellar basal body-associated FliL family protein [Halieaceae bacterium]MCH1579154.1 flagellar basal body-associated FliL family protein [Luminiphilus sp.]MDA8553825.1 flagellar basal body-associated FliL family protein [Luminiphilus sp.]MDA8619962.1 flagellar basal body-associated FliL family protein [Luminiphilus sp.]|tara:strand:+ start:693 stop:1280 length:588 start_codon:yes stop_codon:yes gene_type:complete
MADEEVDTGEENKKSPIVGYILIGVGVVVAMAITVLATMYFVGYFDPDSAERIEETVQQLEMDAAEARQRAEELAKGPSKETLDSPELTRFENTYMEIERPLVANIVNSRKVMQIKVAIMTHYDDRVVANMEKHAFAIRSEMLDVMRKIDDARLAEPNFRADLAEQLKIAVNSVLEKYEDFGGVEQVLFTEFVVQ